MELRLRLMVVHWWGRSFREGLGYGRMDDLMAEHRFVRDYMWVRHLAGGFLAYGFLLNESNQIMSNRACKNLLLA